MLKIAIVGANGFVGMRLVEMLHLGELATVIPIVRSFTGLAGISKFDLDWRIASALDQAALTKAFKGCDIAIHCVSGDAPVIVDSVTPCYLAAQAAGIHRFIYLSSAAVHGQAPPSGTTESSPLKENQAIAYNNAKVRAERILAGLRKNGTVETVVLRPGIVLGPRSLRWIATIADDLLKHRAYLINNGAGICNSTYVDNLVNAIHLSLLADSKLLDGHAFLLGDEEEVTWLQVYSSLASALRIDPASISRLAMPTLAYSWLDVFNQVRASGPVQRLLPLVPDRLKRATKAALLEACKESRPTTGEPAIANGQSPFIDKEMALLQSCTYKLPFTKAEKKLGYRPLLTFSEGMRRSIAWLAFVGYPVEQASYPYQAAYRVKS